MKGKGVSDRMLDVENPVLKSFAYGLLLLAYSRENYSEGEGADEVRVRFLSTWFKKKNKKNVWTSGFPSCYLLHILWVNELSKPFIYFPILDQST